MDRKALKQFAVMASMLGVSSVFDEYREPRYLRRKQTGHRTAHQQKRRNKNRIANKSRAMNFRRAK